MALTRAIVTIPMTSANPKDAVTNTLYFATSGSVSSAHAQITTRIKAFYNVIKNTTLSSHCDLSNAYIKYYDMNDTPPRAPVAIDVLGITGFASDTGLPHDVAMCVSFQASRLSGIPQRFRRGRIFLGPLKSTVNSGGMILSTVQDTVAGEAGTMRNGCTTDGNPWVIHTPSYPGGLSNVAVADGWIDNEFDTQRRRGQVSTRRVTW